MSTCIKCDGKGTHVHDAIDEGGFQSQGPDDSDAYFSGVYDVKCTDCGGTGKSKLIFCDTCEKETPHYTERYQEYPGAGFCTDYHCEECANDT